MKKLSTAFAFLWIAAASAWAGASEPRPIVVEVFTSQGCSSCGPANALAYKVAQRPNVLLLSLPVTYWDMFGWKDTLASDQNTKRQKSYAAALRRGGVYTPQMIIDGVKDVPAAREDAVSYALTIAGLAREDAQLADGNTPAVARREGGDVAFVGVTRLKSSARAVWSVPVQLTAKQPGKLHLTIDRAPDITRYNNIDATIWVFTLRSSATVKIGGGENNGQTVTYKNVVTGIANVGRWRGEQLSMDLARPNAGNKTPLYDAIAVVVQQGGYGRVRGAAYAKVN